MKLERLHESVLHFIVLLVGLGVAIGAGSMVGSGRSAPAFIIIGLILATGFFLKIRERVWILIPATAMLGGKVSLLPLPFTIAQLGVLFALGTFLILKGFKKIRIQPAFGIVEATMVAMLCYLVTVYARNPVGVEAMGADRVGGRPYVNIVIAYLGCWVLSRAVATPLMAQFVPLANIAGNAFHAFLNALAFAVPGLVGPLSMMYSGLTAAELAETAPGSAAGEELTRKGHLSGLGGSLWLYACTKWRPATVVNPLFPFRFLLFLFAVYAVLQSGFRSALVNIFMLFLVGSYFRKGWLEVFKAILVCLCAVGLLVSLQGRIVQLPYAAQRALSFLPGEWDYFAKREAEGSTEWRVEMWKAMLTGDKYIANKWLGDGFGFTRYQMQIMAENMKTGSQADIQENFMISGGVHSGPITAIRYVGFVGLAIFLTLLILVAFRAQRLIRQAEGTPFYTMALFIGIPSILHPFGFVVIFGAFETDFPAVIIAVGMQQLLTNSLAAYPASKEDVANLAPASSPGRRTPKLAAAGQLG